MAVVQSMSDRAIAECLLQEVSEQVELYSSLAVDHTGIISETTRYLEQKAYDSDVADMLLNALCNALRVDAVVIQWSPGCGVNTICLKPGRPGAVSAGTISLVLQGTGLGAHYNAVFPFQLTPPSRTPHPLQHTNTTPQHTNSRAQFDPTEVQPLPKAGGLLRFERAKGASRPLSPTHPSRKHWPLCSWRQNRKKLPQRVQNPRKRLSPKKKP